LNILQELESMVEIDSGTRFNPRAFLMDRRTSPNRSRIGLALDIIGHSITKITDPYSPKGIKLQSRMLSFIKPYKKKDRTGTGLVPVL